MNRLVTVTAGLLLAIAPVGATQAFAAQPNRAASVAGNDISWPQCGTSYPARPAFGIVGVNGGKASNVNGCFASEWAWAQTATGAANQPRAQLYVNTGNPGDVLAQYGVTDWPTSSIAADPYGQCSGTWTDDRACSWQYGYDRASADTKSAGTSTGSWWLDIETSNSWTSDFAKNQATLEGMVYALKAGGATVGIYASSGSWSSLFGAVASASPLYSLNEWRPGARSLNGAQSNCALAPFEGNGKVTLTQYVSQNLDYDYSCV